MASGVDKARSVWERYEFMLDNGHLDYTKQFDEDEGFYLGDGQWSKSDKDALTAESRPCETINQILPKINNLVGEQINTRTEISAKPRDTIGDPKTASTITKVFKQIQQSNRMKDLITDVVEDGFISGRGFLDFTVEFKTPGQPGDIKCKRKHPKTILIDPYGDSYDPEDWADFIESRFMSYNDIRALFGKAKADGIGAKAIGSTDTTYGMDSIRPYGFGGENLKGARIGDNEAVRALPIIRVNARQVKEWTNTKWFLDPRTRDTSQIPYDWDEDRINFVAQNAGQLVITLPQKRVKHIIAADNVLLFDEWSIYRTFTIVPFFPMFRWGRPLGVVENLKGPQRVVNKMSSQQLHILNTTANGGWIVEDDSLVNLTVDELKRWGSKTGLVIVHKKGSAPPAKIQPNQISQGMDRLEFLAKQNIKEISTVNDSRLGDDREDVAAKAIVAKQQRGAVNSARYNANEERTQWMCGRKMLELAQDFYTEERVLRITGQDPVSNVTQTEDVPINQPQSDGSILNDLSIGEYDIIITSTPAKDNLQETQFDEAARMREMGVQLPDSVLIRNSALENKEEIAQAMAEDPLAQEMKRAELDKEKAEVVDTFAAARKKDAETQAIIAELQGARLGEVEQPQEPSVSEGQKFQVDRITNLLKATQNAEIKRISERGKAKNVNGPGASGTGTSGS
jgi:hypothetical protein